MPINIKIRAAKLADLEIVYVLALQLSESVLIDKKALDRNFKTLLNDKNHFVLIAENGTSVVGYLSGYLHTTIYANGKTANADEIVVTLKNRGKNIGKKLMSEFDKIAKSKHCVLVSLATSVANVFYEKLGYFSKASYFKKYLD